MPGVNGEIKKDGLETVDEKRDLGAKPKKVDDKSSKTRRTSEVPSLDAERQCLVQRPSDQQWRKSMFFFVLHHWFTTKAVRLKIPTSYQKIRAE